MSRHSQELSGSLCGPREHKISILAVAYLEGTGMPLSGFQNPSTGFSWPDENLKINDDDDDDDDDDINKLSLNSKSLLKFYFW